MQQFKIHILTKILSVVLITVLLIPSAVKLGHVFENHKHEVCTDNASTHLHSLDMDCEFYKFKLNNQLSFTPDYFQVASLDVNHKIIQSQYFFISEFQQLQVALRGPPLNS